MRIIYELRVRCSTLRELTLSCMDETPDMNTAMELMREEASLLVAGRHAALLVLLAAPAAARVIAPRLGQHLHVARVARGSADSLYLGAVPNSNQ